MGISYATHRVRIPDGLLAEKIVVFGASRSQPHGLGMLFYGDGIWALTTFGVAKAAAPQNFDEMCALADRLLPAIWQRPSVRASRSATPPFHKYPASRWRRRQTRPIPRRDPAAGRRGRQFQPTYGRGMTMTSLQARRLQELLEDVRR